MMLPPSSLTPKTRDLATMMLSFKKKIPTLVELSIQTAIHNIGDVGETDIFLLKDILTHCTTDQLMHIEKSSENGAAYSINGVSEWSMLRSIFFLLQRSCLGVDISCGDFTRSQQSCNFSTN